MIKDLVKGYGAPLSQWQSTVGRRALNALLPPRCPVSDQAVAVHGTMTPKAWAKLHHLAPPWCTACGLPFERADIAAEQCVACTAPSIGTGRLTGRGGLYQIRSALAYSDHLAPAVLRLKYADRTDGVRTFANLMAAVARDILDVSETIIVPVPLHTGRLRKRRYNQAELLADGLAQVTGATHHPRSIVRTRPTPTQKGGSRTARRRNVAGAFAIAQPELIEGRRVIIVDDVLTTGATLLACARPLKAAGATQVSAVTLARVIKSVQSSPYDGGDGPKPF